MDVPVKKLTAKLGFLSLLLGALQLIPSYAVAATTGTLTVVSSGGATEGTGWSYTAGVIELSANSSINASDIEAKLALGDLTLFADEIRVNAGLTFGSSNLTFKANGSIRIPGGIQLASTGGDVVLQADSDDSGVGEIRLGTLATDGGSISTGGGNIWLVGGSDPASGSAMATNSSETSKPSAGVGLYGFDLDAGGGNIVIRGSSPANTGTSTRAVMFELTSTSQGSTISTSGSGSVSITGDGSAIQSGNPWGITISALGITTENGDVTLNAKANTSYSNARGLVAGNLTISSSSGNVSISDITNGSAANYTGTYISGGGVIISSAGSVVFKADKYQSDGLLDLAVSSFRLESFTGNSFVAATNLGRFDLTGTSLATFGNSANTANLVINQPITSDGIVILNSSGTVTQSNKIEATGLGFGSTGAVSLSNSANDVDRIAAGTDSTRVGNFTYLDSNGLELGTVGSLSGIHSSGVINIATNSSDLVVTQTVSTNKTGADSLLLYADKDSSAGAAGDGNIKFSGNYSLSIDATARALLYSGSRSSSTLLTVAVGGESNVRTNVDATSVLSSISPSLASTGLFALYRTTTATAPGSPSSVNATSVVGSKTAQIGWVAPTDTGGSSITGYKIEINDGSGWQVAIANTESSATTADVTDLVIGSSYSFRVFAINGSGTSLASTASTSITILGTPAPTPYSGPLITNLARLPISEGSIAIVTVTGTRLDLTLKASVDGKQVRIVSASSTEMVLELPALSAGIKDLIIESNSGRLTHQDAFYVFDAAFANVDVTDAKVNAGSFNGYIAVYAKGFKGRTLSWRIAGVWFKTFVEKDYAVYQRKTVAVGLEVIVKLYIDGEELMTKNVVTR